MTHVVSVAVQPAATVTTVDDPTSVDTALTNALVSTVAATSTVGVSPYLIINEGGVGGGGFGSAVDGAVSAGASTLTMADTPPLGFASHASLVTVGSGLTCEIRAISAVTGSQLTFDRALTNAHSDLEPVIWYPAGVVPLGMWGAKGDNSTDDTTAIQAAIDQTARAGNGNCISWVTGLGARYLVTRPLVFSSHSRVKGVGFFKATSGTWGTQGAVAEATNSLAMSCQNLPVTFTALASTNTLTLASDPDIGAVGNKVVVVGASLPSPLISGRVYFVKTLPSTTTLTLSTRHTLTTAVVAAAAATVPVTYGDTANFPSSGSLNSGGTTFTYTGITSTSFTGCSGTPAMSSGAHVFDVEIDLTTDGSGTCYSDVIANSRVYLDDVYFHGGNIASLNGFNANFQQPCEWRKVRFDAFPGYGLQVIGQLGYFYNLETVSCGKGVVLPASSSGMVFYGFNIDNADAGTGIEVSGARNCAFYGTWLEGTAIGLRIAAGADTTHGLVVDGIQFSNQVANPCVKIDQGVAQPGGFELRGARVGSANQLVIDDVDRGFQLLASDLDQHTSGLAVYSQPGGKVAPFISNQSVLSKTTTYTATVGDQTILCSATGGAFTVTLPTAVGIKGKKYTIKRTNSGANAVTVGTTSSQTIDLPGGAAATTRVLGAQYTFVDVMSDGTNWMLIGMAGTVT